MNAQYKKSQKSNKSLEIEQQFCQIMQQICMSLLSLLSSSCLRSIRNLSNTLFTKNEVRFPICSHIILRMCVGLRTIVDYVVTNVAYCNICASKSFQKHIGSLCTYTTSTYINDEIISTAALRRFLQCIILYLQ